LFDAVRRARRHRAFMPVLMTFAWMFAVPGALALGLAGELLRGWEAALPAAAIPILICAVAVVRILAGPPSGAARSSTGAGRGAA
jgi:hypothetical protein